MQSQQLENNYFIYFSTC